MAKKCFICGKTSLLAGQRKKLMSRYNPTPKKRKQPNLQWVYWSSNNNHQRVKACTKCIKTIGKEK